MFSAPERAAEACGAFDAFGTTDVFRHPIRGGKINLPLPRVASLRDFTRGYIPRPHSGPRKSRLRIIVKMWVKISAEAYPTSLFRKAH